jgi:hypothetical protein
VVTTAKATQILFGHAEAIERRHAHMLEPGLREFNI